MKLSAELIYRVLEINSWFDEAEAFLAIVDQNGRLTWYSNRYFECVRLETLNDRAVTFSFHENLIKDTY